MVLSIPKSELFEYIRRQMNCFFPDRYDFIGSDVSIAFDIALERLEHCLGAIALRGYHDENGNAYFSHLHADQYAQFIYFLGNSLWKQSENRVLCDKLLQLNRVLHSIFISYKCNLPEYFVLSHPIGTILGNANYGNFLVVSQGVTVNTMIDDNGNISSDLGKGLFLGSHCKIIGNNPIGDRVSIGTGTLVYKRTLPDDCVVYQDGEKGVRVAPRKRPECRAQSIFNIKI